MWLRSATEHQMIFQAQLSQYILETKGSKASVTETQWPFSTCICFSGVSWPPEFCSWSSTKITDLYAFCWWEFQLLWGTRKISGLLLLEEVFPSWWRPGWALENVEKTAVSICIHNKEPRIQHKEANLTAQGTFLNISNFSPWKLHNQQMKTVLQQHNLAGE